MDDTTTIARSCGELQQREASELESISSEFELKINATKTHTFMVVINPRNANAKNIVVAGKTIDRGDRVNFLRSIVG